MKQYKLKLTIILTLIYLIGFAQSQGEINKPKFLIMPGGSGKNLLEEMKKPINKILYSTLSEFFISNYQITPESYATNTQEFNKNNLTRSTDDVLNIEYTDRNNNLSELILNNSRADFYIKYEVMEIRSSNRIKVHLSLTGISIRGRSEIASVSTSEYDAAEQFYSPGIEISLAKYQLEELIEKNDRSFVEQLFHYFDTEQKEGTPIPVSVHFTKDAEYNGYSTVDDEGNTITDILDEFFEVVAKKGIYSDPSTSSRAILFSNVNLPLRKPNGMPFKRSRDFIRPLRKMLNKKLKCGGCVTVKTENNSQIGIIISKSKN
ncbi:MAG: DUF6175 family protein [Flavobacteriales bacterium]|jgi:hypothetical protein|nr:DUF6175 family protein [Flavobacteriales bacterium]